VKRRTAIKQIGFGLSASLALPSFLAGCDDKETGPEVPFDGVVGVIGAGAAGLFAADILRSKGINVRIFEANNRVGGRIYSIRSFDPKFESYPTPDFPLELGAEKILGSNGPWGEIIKQLRVPTLSVQDASVQKFFTDGVLKTETEALTDPDFAAAQNFLANLSTISGNSVQEAISAAGINPRMHAILNSLIGNNFGTNNATLGASGLAEALTLRQRDTQELVLRFNPMQDVLISRFSNALKSVELNKEVKAIDYSGETINLMLNNPITGAIENVVVNKLIIAVPLSILKDGDITFSPSLPTSKSSAMSRIGFGASMRVVLDFRQNLWGTDTSFIQGGTQSPIYFNTGLSRSEFHKNLTVTINGPKAEQLALDPDNIVTELVKELDTVLDGKASINLKTATGSGIIIQDWTKEEFIKGGYSYPLAGGGEEDRVALAEPIDGTLFFAGEATDVKGDWGTVNGALNSGERAALELIDSILNPVVV
jgi:monoamine oxidase